MNSCNLFFPLSLKEEHVASLSKWFLPGSQYLKRGDEMTSLSYLEPNVRWERLKIIVGLCLTSTKCRLTNFYSVMFVYKQYVETHEIHVRK